MTPDADLGIAGGGPAGLAVAIRARQEGLTATVVDPGRPPIDKACGEGLMPDGASLMDRLGVAISPDRCCRLRGIRWIDGDTIVEGTFPGPPGLGVPRSDLHGALARRAEEAGADLRWGVAVRGLTTGGLATSRGLLRATWLVAADGRSSPLRRMAGLEARLAPRRRLGLTRHYAIEPWTDRVEVHWSDVAEAYVTPLGPRQVGVALLYEGPRPDFEMLLGRFPRLRERLRGARATERQRGAGPLEQRTTAAVRGNLALVGDAAGSIDALTGEGLSLAFRDAFLLVEAILRGDLSQYAAARRRSVRLPAAFARVLLAIQSRPAVRRRVLRALSRDPDLFQALLEAHVRARDAVPLVAWALPRLAWDLALARPPRAGNGQLASLIRKIFGRTSASGVDDQWRTRIL